MSLQTVNFLQRIWNVEKCSEVCELLSQLAEHFHVSHKLYLILLHVLPKLRI
jgi:hypothetical protein